MTKTVGHSVNILSYLNVKESTNLLLDARIIEGKDLDNFRFGFTPERSMVEKTDSEYIINNRGK
jgi:hypothetical protein